MPTADRLRLEGYARGHTEGHIEGRIEGRLEGKAEVLLHQLQRRFGPLPPAVAARIGAASAHDLHAWTALVFVARSLEGVFNPRLFETVGDQIRREGYALGYAEGRIAGRAEGRAEGKVELLLQELHGRFGALPQVITARVRAAHEHDLHNWFDRMLDAKVLDDVFTPPA